MRDFTVKMLNQTLENSKQSFCSVIIMGRTGAGKSELIDEWFASHPEIVQQYFDAASHPRTYDTVLEPDGSKTKLDTEIYFTTDQSDRYNSKNNVLLIDHFDLTRDSARKHLLNLIEKREVVYDFSGEVKKLDNLKYIIALAYPKGESHFGYSPLTNDDIEMFDVVIQW